MHWLLSQITRDYDEEEQGYDSEKEREERKDSDDSALSPRSVEGNGRAHVAKQAKVNGADDHHEEDMDVSDWAVRLVPSCVLPLCRLWKCFNFPHRAESKMWIVWNSSVTQVYLQVYNAELSALMFLLVCHITLSVLSAFCCYRCNRLQLGVGLLCFFFFFYFCCQVSVFFHILNLFIFVTWGCVMHRSVFTKMRSFCILLVIWENWLFYQGFLLYIKAYLKS